MADIVGSGSGSLGGLAPSSVNYDLRWADVDLEVPTDLEIYPSTLVTLGFVLDTWDNDSTSVQVQLANEPTFSSPLFDQMVTGAVADGVTLRYINVAGLSNLGTYYWRARPVYIGPYQPPWADFEVWSFQVNITASIASEYLNLNAGVEITPKSEVLAYINLNAGVMITLMSSHWVYVDLNMGVMVTMTSFGYQSVEEGNVSNNIPKPHIWFLRPTAGRPFDGIDVVGFGFGDLQVTYDGIPQINMGIDDWEAVTTSDWQSYPPKSNAYLSTRMINELTNQIDPQHQIVSIIIPADAEPPGHPVRIKTEGS